MQLLLARSFLRPPRAEDAPSIARHADNRAIWRNLGERFPLPYTLVDAEAFIASHVGEEPTCTFVIELAQQVVGCIGLAPSADVHRRSMEIGYWLAEPHWGRGIMTEAVQAVTAYAFGTFDINRVFAEVFGWNLASARVLVKAGYTFEGTLRGAVTKDGQTTDELIYAMVRG